MNFENLSQTWQNQHKNKPETKAEDIIKMAKQKAGDFKRGQIISISILSLTFLVLVGFYIGVEAYQNFTGSLGLVLMIVMLLARIALEIKSKSQLQNIDSALSFQDFVAKHKRYFKKQTVDSLCIYPSNLPLVFWRIYKYASCFQSASFQWIFSIHSN